MSPIQAIVAARGRILEAGRPVADVSPVVIMAIALEIFRAAHTTLTQERK